MTGLLTWAPTQVDEIPNSQYSDALRDTRIGVMLHFDASGSDAGAVQWFRDPRCKVSYQLLVLDDGSYVRIAPDSARAWHAGACRPSSARLRYKDANSAFYGISAATNGTTDVTPLQLATIALLTRRYFDVHGWSLDETWRIVGHRTEAWPRGRKSDPEGPSLTNPIFSPADVIQLLPRVGRVA